ncbi:TPA: hypothetical protein PC598_003921 [Morganella morganii]|uniref:hypothetical protein n=1 Tax=Morganella morganii TaxID=582 RepID=UPI00046A6A80|nr:hypothetical protein [Morganella morganii]HDF2344264.1 hypothetical protein [Morganella morganii]
MNLYNSIPVAVILAASALTGCSYNTALSPPADSRMIHFSATVPDALESLPLSAVYRSKKCTRTEYDSRDKPYEVAKANWADYPLTAVNGRVSAAVPVSGGGYCDWTLSSLTYEVRLKHPHTVDPEITDNFGFETVFITGNYAPAVFNGGYIPHRGDFRGNLLLFPFIRDIFLGKQEKTFHLVAEDDMVTYRLAGAENIHLTVDYEQGMLSRWTDIKEKKPGNKTVITYPDGEEERKGKIYPSYKKLLKIREARRAAAQR